MTDHLEEEQSIFMIGMEVLSKLKMAGLMENF
jgi:hypothetical protein